MSEMKNEAIKDLLDEWAKDEQQYRAQANEAKRAGTPWTGTMAHADQLRLCMAQLQRAIKPPNDQAQRPPNETHEKD